MAESVECLTLDFDSGYDLRIVRSSSAWDTALAVESA